ncbi:MAG: 3TM-type holin [Candidatus Heimdallarchaeota archaeon]
MFSIIGKVIPFLAGSFSGKGKSMKESIINPITVIGNIVDNLTTSDEERGKIEIEKEKLKYQLSVLQSEIMKAEIQNGRGKWRSAIGWICAYCLGIYFAVQPTFGFFTHAYVFFNTGKWTPISFNIHEIMELLASILCVGTLKTIEKIKMRK